LPTKLSFGVAQLLLDVRALDGEGDRAKDRAHHAGNCDIDRRPLQVVFLILLERPDRRPPQ
jgi:hypothetical protein